VKALDKTYGIESELGSLTVKGYELSDSDGNAAFSAVGGFFPTLSPKERFRSARYKELEYQCRQLKK